jgi:hypothetical protein
MTPSIEAALPPDAAERLEAVHRRMRAARQPIDVSPDPRRGLTPFTSESSKRAQSRRQYSPKAACPAGHPYVPGSFWWITPKGGTRYKRCKLCSLDRRPNHHKKPPEDLKPLPTPHLWRDAEGTIRCRYVLAGNPGRWAWPTRDPGPRCQWSLPVKAGTETTQEDWNHAWCHQHWEGKIDPNWTSTSECLYKWACASGKFPCPSCKTTWHRRH